MTPGPISRPNRNGGGDLPDPKYKKPDSGDVPRSANRDGFSYLASPAALPNNNPGGVGKILKSEDITTGGGP